MNTQQTVALQLGFWHGAAQGMMNDCSPETLGRTFSGATVSPIGAIFAHAVWSEDSIVNGMLQGRPPLYVADGWEAKTGIPYPGSPPALNPEWAGKLNMNLAPFMDYAQAVFAGTDAYLAHVSDADLQRKLKTPAGEQTAEWMVAAILATHFPQHIGEIAALKGFQGLKGLPF